MKSRTKKHKSKGPRRSYKHQTVKLLWGRAAGRCSAPECRISLIADEKDYDPAVPIGDIAHVEAASNSGPRPNSALTQSEKNDYKNLILLCKNCHDKFDKQKHFYSEEYIKELKRGHEDWVKASLPERGRSKCGWKAVLMRGQHPLDSRSFDEALAPDYIIGEPLEIYADASMPWEETSARMRNAVAGLFNCQELYDSRFAVFPLARVSACIYLGYLLTNRPTVRLFRYNPDEQTWKWSNHEAARFGIPVEPVKDIASPTAIAFLFELSARIDRERVVSRLPADTRIISVGIPDPRTNRLHDPRQLQTLGVVARELFEDCINLWPQVQRWHIFYAGPAPGGVIVGQQLNPTMIPPVQLYEYDHPSHTESLLLRASGNRER